SCGSRFERGCAPLLWSGSDASEAVLLLDGVGSWGAGAEAAAWFRARLAAFVAGRRELTTSAISDALSGFVSELPPEIRDADFGWSFSFGAALLVGSKIHVATRGGLSVVLLRGDAIHTVHKPARLIDDLVALGHIRADEAEQHDLRRVLKE